MIMGTANPGASLLSEANGTNGTISPVLTTHKNYCRRNGGVLMFE
jgi:hypothetical protein